MRATSLLLLLSHSTTLLLLLIDSLAQASELPNWSSWLRSRRAGGALSTCASARDCNMLGDCLEGRCVCDEGFKGAQCEELDLLPTDPDWGLNDESHPSWGGTVIYDNGEYHMIASYMQRGCDISMYATNSAVLRATSPNPQGPFTYRETVLRPFHHGAHVVRSDKTGLYMIFADGKDIPASRIHDCKAVKMKTGMPQHQADTMHGRGPHDQVVVAVSDRLASGKWKEHIVLRTDLNAGWACNRTNPAPLLTRDEADEEILTLAFRTTYCSHDPSEPVPKCRLGPHATYCQHLTVTRFAVNVVPSPESSPTLTLVELRDPFSTSSFNSSSPQTNTRRGAGNYKKMLALEGSEDPFIWYNPRRGGSLHVLAHSKNACKEEEQEGCGLLGFSTDGGRTWTSARGPAYDSHVSWRGGGGESLKYRQRPKLLLDDEAVPIMLYNGVRRRGDGKKLPFHIQTLATPFNVTKNRHLVVAPPQSNNREVPAIEESSPPPEITSIPPHTEDDDSQAMARRMTPSPKVLASTPGKNLRGPNFLLIHLDDVGSGDISAYGMDDAHRKRRYHDAQTQTPEIDRMAREGTRFTSFYSASCVCTPSRAGILTGRYPIRTSLHPGVIGPSDARGLPHEEMTLARALKTSLGYRTMMAGKWHLGHLPPYLPHNHGFERWTGMPYSQDYCPCPTRLTHTPDNECREFEPPCPLMNNSLIVQQPARLDELTEYYADAAVQFMREVTDSPASDPFFVYYACHHLHHPQFVNLKNLGAGKRAGGRSDALGDAAWEMDAAVGKLLDFLRSTPRLRENTYVILASDNGAAVPYGKLGGSNGIYRCGKGTNWEGGQRVPFIVWGGATRSGAVVDEIVAGMDVFKTIMTLAGVKDGENSPITSARAVDSIDFSPLLFGGEEPGEDDSAESILTNHENRRRRHFIYYQLGNGGVPGAVRVGDYKVHFYTSAWMEKAFGKLPSCHAHTENLGYQKRPLVYDVKKDPGETTPIPTSDSRYSGALELARKLLARHACNHPGDAACRTTPAMNCAVVGSLRPQPIPPSPFQPWRQEGYYCCDSGWEVVYDHLISPPQQAGCIKVEPGETSDEVDKRNGPSPTVCFAGKKLCNPARALHKLRCGANVEVCRERVAEGSKDGAVRCANEFAPSGGAKCPPNTERVYCPHNHFQCRDGTCVPGERVREERGATCARNGGILFTARLCGVAGCGISSTHTTTTSSVTSSPEEVEEEHADEEGETLPEVIPIHNDEGAGESEREDAKDKTYWFENDRGESENDEEARRTKNALNSGELLAFFLLVVGGIVVGRIAVSRGHRVNFAFSLRRRALVAREATTSSTSVAGPGVHEQTRLLNDKALRRRRVKGGEEDVGENEAEVDDEGKSLLLSS